MDTPPAASAMCRSPSAASASRSTSPRACPRTPEGCAPHRSTRPTHGDRHGAAAPLATVVGERDRTQRTGGYPGRAAKRGDQRTHTRPHDQPRNPSGAPVNPIRQSDSHVHTPSTYQATQQASYWAYQSRSMKRFAQRVDRMSHQGGPREREAGCAERTTSTGCQSAAPSVPATTASSE